jgi:type II secretory ATPase GspE/PulE/Tfp pilus assembly ATPase PilB-like protein
MYPDIKTIKSALLQQSYISEADSKAAEAASQTGADYVAYLIRAELLSPQILGQALAESYKTPYVDLNAHAPEKETIGKIPEVTARANRVIFLKENDKLVAVATDNPPKVNLTEVEQFFPHKKVRVAYALPEAIESAFALYEQPLDTRFSEIIKGGTRVAPEIVDEILKDALTYRASDIHFEPQVKDVTVRFRVDGNLRHAGTLPRSNYDNILNRIKVESGMRIDEHFAAQDGTLQRTSDDRRVDFRVSLVPTVQGEKVVMRVLGSYVREYSLADIGLDDTYRERLEAYSQKPFGMILTVGPTGSGKTTTLYAILKLLNRPNVNITSIEDPVEYKVASINQIQVREASGMTFAKGLRAIVRQDPDIILVGEIRDEETADISVNAALTGHLLLSTFHANDAATAIPRLVDMGIEPFLLASTLEVIIAQRLVRQLCPSCRYSISASEAVKALKLNAKAVAPYFSKDETVYAGKGCNVCNGTGYKGRTALFEFLEVTPEMQDLIVKNPSNRDIEKLARSQGAEPMFDDGIKKVKMGVTTISEVLRVVAPPHEHAS